MLAMFALLVVMGSAATAQTSDLTTELTDARRIFVPAEDLDVVVERDRRGAMLTKKKFEELLGLAKANAAKNSVPNLPIVLTSSTYQARVAGDQLLLSVTAELTQFASDWQSVGFAMQRLSVEKATLDEEPAMLGRNQDGSVTLLSDQKGKHVLKLELSTELGSLGSDQAAAFSLLRAPSGMLSLTLPAGKRLLVGALQLERPAPLEQAADYKIAIGGAPGVQLRITDRAADNAADALTFATTGYGLHVAPGEVTWHALTTLQVFGKPIDRLTVSVPNTLEIADIESTGLESWDSKDDPADKLRTIISLTFGQAFDGVRKISFKGVMAVEAGKPWTVPPLTISNVTSHIGQVVVQHPAGVRLRVEETTGVRRATQGQKPTADMPDDMSKMNATEFLRFDIWQPDFVLRLITQPKQREVQTAVAAVLDVNATGLDLQALVTVKTQFAPLFELDVRLPADWTVLSAHRDATSLKWQVLSQEPGVNQLRILLDTPLAAEASGTVRLALRRDVEGWPVEATPITVALPELFLPQSNLNEGTFVVRGDDDLDLTTSELSGLDTVPLKADFERLRFQSQDTRYGGNLKVTRKPSRIAVQTITVGRLDPQTMHAFIQAMVEVQGGGVRILKVALPELAGTALRFQSPGRQIVEQKPGAVQNGERIWTLQFDQRVRGIVPLFCDVDLPRGDVKEFVVPQARFIDAERQNGFQAVEAGGEQKLTIDAKGADGTPLVDVDPLDLPNVFYTPKERVVAVYRNVTAGTRVTLSEERFDKLAVPTAVCPMLNVTSVLGRTGELQHRAVFQLTAVGVQGLRVTLPRETSLWATLVDGQPVEVRRQGDIYLIPFTAGYAVPTPYQGGPHVGQTRQLQLFYQSEVPALTQFGSLEQPPPELSVQTGQGTSQPVDVLDQRWQLHYPAKTLLVSSRGPLEPEQRLDDTSLLGRLGTGVRVPTVEELGWQIFAVIVTLGVIALLLMAYRKYQSVVPAIGLLVLMLGVGFLFTFAAQERMNSTSYSTKSTKTTARSESAGRAPSAPMSEPKKSEPQKNLAAMNEVTMFESGVMRPEEKKDESPASSDFAKPQMAAEMPGPPQDYERKLSLDIRQNQVTQEQMEVAQDLNRPMQQERKEAPDPRGVRQDNNLDQAAKADPYLGKDRLALLSLAIDLTPPDGSLQKTFRYAGAAPARGGISLQLGYVDEHSGTVLRLFLVALMALVGWFLRGSSCSTKATLAVLGLTLPLALLPLVPHSLQIALDGVFFGVVVACGLWLLVGIVRCLATCCQSCCRWNGTKKLKNLPSTGTTIGAWVVATLLLGGSAFAQPKGQAPNAAPEKPVAPVIHETTLVVPFDAGTDPLAADKILLPFDKFVELYRQAYPDKPIKGTAPHDGGVVEALYAAKIVPNEKTPDESTVEVTARYAIRSYVDGQLQVELPVGGVAARSAKLDGKNAPLIVNGVCSKVAISTPGLHVVDFVFSVPARLSGSTGSLTLPLLPVPTGKLSLVLPAKDLSVRINGSSTIFRRVVKGDVQSIEVPVDKGGDLAIAWQPEQAKGAAAAVVHVDSVQAVMLTDEGVRVNSGFEYRVRQGGVADVTFTLPATYRLQAVKGADVGGWELQGEGDARKLRVIFRRNVTDTTQLAVEAFLDVKVGVEATLIDIPQLAPQEVTNEIGQIAVYVQNQFTLRADKVESLAQIDADKFNTAVPVARPKDAPQLAYRFSKRPFTLSLRATRQESQANVAAQHAAFVTLRKQQLTTRLLYNLTGAPRSSFNIALPEGYVVLDVKATGLHDWSLGKLNDQASLTIDLDGPRLGLAEVVLSGTVPRDNDSTSASLTFPRPLDATKLNSTVAVWLDEGFTGTLDTFDGWRSVDASLVSGELKAVRPNLPVQFAFTSTATAPSPVTLKLQSATPKLTANGLAMVSVTDVAVVHTLALQWQIDAATTDALVFTTPSFLAGKLEFTGSGIRESTHVDAGNGRTRWTIWLRTPVSGKYFAAAVATLPPAAKEVQAPSIVFERAVGVAVEGQRQYVLLINLSQSQLTSASPELSESVQREDVPVVVDQSLVDQATELVRVKQLLTAPRWTLQTFVQTASAPASVNVADLTTIINRDGTYRGQAIYIIKNRSRQFLALKLPANAELMSVFVGNLPSRAVTTKRNNEDMQLIALPKTSAASLSFPVRVIWRGSLDAVLPKSARMLRQEIDFAAPKVVSQQDDPEFGIPVAKTRWTVWLPDDLDAQPLKIATRHNMTLQATDQNDLLYEKAAVQELSELLGFVDQNYSFRQQDNSRRPQSSNNMKQLGLALHNAEQLERSVQSARGDQEFDWQRKQALSRLSDLKKAVAAEQSQPGAGFNVNNPSLPLGNNVAMSNLPQGNNLSSGIDNNFRGIAVNGFEGINLQSDGSQNSLGNTSNSIVSNTVTLFQSNNGTGVNLQKDKEIDGEGFQFELQNKGEPQKAAEQAGKPITDNGSAARQALRRGNSANVDSLNQAINQQKVAGQQGQGGFGGGQFGGAYGVQPGQNPQGGQGGFGGQQGLWNANPNNYNPQYLSGFSFIGGGGGGGAQAGQNQQGGQGGFGGGQFGGQFGGPVFTNQTITGNSALSASNGVNLNFSDNITANGGIGFANAGGTVIAGKTFGRNESITPLDGPRYGQPTLSYSGIAGTQTGVPLLNKIQVGGGAGSQPSADAFNRQMWGMPVTGTPIGLPGAQHAPRAGQPNANLDGLADFALINEAAAAVGPGGGFAGWTQTGGLSLGFELPTTGKKLVFSKAGGDPKLALAVRPQESIRWGLNLVWSAVWLGIGLGTVLAIRSASVVGHLTRQLPLAVAAISILGFFVLPKPLSGCAFATFVIAALILAWINRKVAKTA